MDEKEIKAQADLNQDLDKSDELLEKEEIVSIPHEIVMRNSIPHNQGHE